MFFTGTDSSKRNPSAFTQPSGKPFFARPRSCSGTVVFGGAEPASDFSRSNSSCCSATSNGRLSDFGPNSSFLNTAS